ncbi:tripartite tricarboxylate transporter substrate binding protein [Methylobacterium sp. J-088]|uniref:Bug family tripartite tricarboxylate transporter substrate binding protein n=1 Tax=Methylobacterium sp. J-088 TaxID=2836664 RepID=UPI001FBBDA32|nr:tripartite tricarboxylate transporter substrate binding protein [Methylobacterium sp. J-088]MCJ2062250.1 tripartite tricarboxylate transporter substrate binding protein [Methylobacterium sp. J-088]
MLTRRSLVGSFALGALGAQTAMAQSPFPAREVTFIVPWNAGGSNDILARGLQPLLKERGITMIVENQPGATGTIGMRRVATANPDGYTLGMGTSSTLAYMAEGKTPLKSNQFTHIARVSIDPLMLLVPGSSPHQTLDDFFAHMKKNPGSVSIGTPGNYNLNHIFASMTARAAGVAYINAPYTGGAKVITDLAGGQIQAAVLKPAESLGQLQQGLVRALGVFADERLRQFPDVPTFKERGYDVFPFGPVVQMAYVVAPAKLPPEVRTKLIDGFSAAIGDQRFKDFAERNAFLTAPLTGDALAAEVDRVEQSIKVVAEKVFKS